MITTQLPEVLAEQMTETAPVAAGNLTADQANVIFYVTFIIMMLFFFFTGAAGEKFHPPFGHETTYTIAFGIIVSIILWYASGGENGDPDAETLSQSFQFSSNFFFDFMLPPLVFSSGYTMHKKKFFDNLGNISLNGFFVTIVCFVIYGAGTIIMVSLDLEMTSYYAEKHHD